MPTTQTLTFHELQPDDAAGVAAVVALDNAIGEHDTPWRHTATPKTVVGLMRYGWDGEPPRCFLARADGVPVAWSQMWLSDYDNTDLAWLDVAVHPDHRRRGVGSQVLARLLQEAAAAGRTKVGADAWDVPGNIAFAEAHGFERKSQAINRRQVLADVDWDAVRRIHDEAERRAGDYELVRVAGRTPDGLIDAVAEMTASINDAPTDDLEVEDEVFPPERIRGYEDACLGQDLRLYRLLARHRETGALAGHTVVAVEAERPEIGEQHDTSVVRDHRGHRLGLLLKSAMMLWLAEAEPALRTVDTWNAESNDHMIEVNEALGYRAMGRSLQYQRHL